MLEHLEFRGFRNLRPASLELGGGTHLILGDNGAGKTSLLEAVYCLATTRSFRTQRIADCVQHAGVQHAGAEHAGAEHGAFHLRGETDLRTLLEVGLCGSERVRKKNGHQTTLAEHLAALPVVAWTSADLDVLIGAPLARRRFLDRGVVGCRPAALAVIGRYRQALAEKRRLLQAQPSSPSSLLDQLAPWNEVMAGAAAELIAWRADYVRRLRVELAAVLEVCRLELPVVELVYKPSPRTAENGAVAVFEQLEAIAKRELAAGQPLCGPHRDELEIRWSGHALRQVASAGERKALGLALTAAHGRVLESVGSAPVYLLDDVDVELDPGRLEALWRHFGSVPQLLASSNRPAVWQRTPIARRYVCSAGELRSQDV